MPNMAVIQPIDLQHKVKSATRAARHDLVKLAELYFTTQVQGQADATIRAKRRDLEHFLQFFFGIYHHHDPAEWYTSVTREWLKRMRRDRRVAKATALRRYNTVRHFARWAHEHVAPFPLGCPTDVVKAPETPEANWYGLERKNELRLLAAAQTLSRVTSQGGTQQGSRDLALVRCLLGSGLRISELLRLEIDQYDGRGFREVLAKGGSRRRFVKLWGRDAKDALETWIEERGAEPGPLFPTRTFRPMTRDQAWRILKRMERQANTHLPAEERFEVTPHTLRHTLLKKLADQKGIHVALKQSGHQSDRYIWRYVQPSEQAMEADDELD